MFRFALYAVGIYRNEMKNKLDNDTKKRLEVASNDLEVFATTVLVNDEKCQKLLPKIPDDMRLNTQELACMASANSFLSKPACKDGITQVWWKELAETSLPTIILLLFIPFLSYCSCFHLKFESCWHIYKVPGVKVLFHGLYFFGFILLYSYMVLRKFRMEMDLLEYVIFGWMILYLVEEILQCAYQRRKNNIRSVLTLLKLHVRSFWNKLDIAKSVLYFVAVITRFVYSFEREESLPLVCQLMFSITALILYIRFLQYFTLHQKVGPLLMTIGTIFKTDIIPFMIILLIFMTGYGVTLQSIIHPQEHVSLNVTLLGSVFTVPYLQFYADIDFDDILAAPGDINHCAPSYDPDMRNYIGVAFAVSYLICTHIILLNLLIAMFNYSYEKVRQDSEYYSYQLMYDVWIEYERKNLFPPPLSWFCRCLR